MLPLTILWPFMTPFIIKYQSTKCYNHRKWGSRCPNSEISSQAGRGPCLRGWPNLWLNEISLVNETCIIWQHLLVLLYVEIYNEELWDLLTDNKRKTTLLSLNIREDKCSSITVQNLKEVAVRNLDRLHCKRGVSKTVSDKLSLANKSYVGLVLSLLSRKFAKNYYC